MKARPSRRQPPSGVWRRQAREAGLSAFRYQPGDLILCVVANELQTGVIWSAYTNNHYQVDFATTPPNGRTRAGFPPERLVPLDTCNIDQRTTIGKRLLLFQARAIAATKVGGTPPT